MLNQRTKLNVQTILIKIKMVLVYILFKFLNQTKTVKRAYIQNKYLMLPKLF